MKKFKGTRDEKGVTHFERKQPVADFIAKGAKRAFEVGDTVLYGGQVKANYGKSGVITGKRDAFGFYITFADGTKASTTAGPLTMLKPRKEPKPKEAKPKAAKPKPVIPEDHAIEDTAERIAENIAGA